MTHPKGFTLIEILIVMIIMGVALSFAILAVGDFGKSREIIMASEQLVKLIQIGQEHAILEPAVIGVKFENHGYGFYRFKVDPKHPSGVWQSLQRDSVLRFRNFPTHCTYRLNAASQKNHTGAPQVMLSSSGDITPFTLELLTDKAKPIATITATSEGTITSRTL